VRATHLRSLASYKDGWVFEFSADSTQLHDLWVDYLRQAAGGAGRGEHLLPDAEIDQSGIVKTDNPGPSALRGALEACVVARLPARHHLGA
jgi:hypothetical protein